MIRMTILLLCAATVGAADYYQADPAKFAAMQAERCDKAQKETGLINKRMAMGGLRKEQVERMQTRLKVLEGDIARNCTTNTGK